MKANYCKKVTKMIAIPTLIVGGLSACGYANNDGARTNVYDGTRVTNDDRYGANTYNVRPNDYDNTNNRMRPNGLVTNQRVAMQAADIAEDVPGVTRATAIVYGNDIVIGIDGRNKRDDKTLEQQVLQKVKNRQQGFNVHVTSDNNLHTRIRTLNTNMTNGNNNNITPGQPVRDVGRDIADLIRDIGRTVTAPFR